MSADELKRLAARHAVGLVRDGMVLGLGSGSTARHATLAIGERVRAGELRNVVAIATSDDTARLAGDLGIPLSALDVHPRIDITIDGADEVAPNLDVIKGLGGYLLREKIVAVATDREIIVVDESKLSERLGTKSPVPVEIIRFGWQNTMAALAHRGGSPRLRHRDGVPFVTDEGHFIADCTFQGIPSPADLGAELKSIAGVVEHGLFLGLVHQVVVASANGVRVIGG